MGGITDNIKCKNPAVLGCGSVSRLEVDPSYLTPQGVWHCGAMLRSDLSKLPFKLGSVIPDKKPPTIPATMVQVTTGDAYNLEDRWNLEHTPWRNEIHM